MATYTPADRMATLIADNFQLIQVMSRFGIKVGFGDNDVAHVCASHGVDCSTFLAVVNFLSSGSDVTLNVSELSLESLVGYLKSSHTYFLEYCFPAIRRKLLDGIRMRTNDVSFLILRMFDEYVDEVRTHMEDENENLFAYISSRINGGVSDNTVSTYSDHHEQVGDKLRELKSIIVKHCPEDADVNLLNAALYEIFRTETELESHCSVEDNLLMPAVRLLEKEHVNEPIENECRPQRECLKDGAESAGKERQEEREEKDNDEKESAEKESLSQREKEIITLVAKGMTNKEIADALFLSVHTVMTHRRNIARKLEIHSATGLAIYAIVNHLVDLKEIKL